MRCCRLLWLPVLLAGVGAASGCLLLAKKDDDDQIAARKAKHEEFSDVAAYGRMVRPVERDRDPISRFFKSDEARDIERSLGIEN